MEQENKSKVVWIVVLFVFLCAGVLSFYAKDWIIMSRENDSRKISLNHKPTLDGTVSVLINKASYQEKSIKSSSLIDQKELNREESMFILSGAKNVSVNKETYTDNKTGFSIQYDLNNNLIDSYNNLRRIARTEPYEIYFSSRANLAAIVNTEGNGRNIRIILKLTNENMTKVEVKIQ